MSEFTHVHATSLYKEKITYGSGIAEYNGKNIFDFINKFYHDRGFHLENKSYALTRAGDSYRLHVSLSRGMKLKYTFTPLTPANKEIFVKMLTPAEQKRDEKAITNLEKVK